MIIILKIKINLSLFLNNSRLFKKSVIFIFFFTGILYTQLIYLKLIKTFALCSKLKYEFISAIHCPYIIKSKHSQQALTFAVIPTLWWLMKNDDDWRRLSSLIVYSQQYHSECLLFAQQKPQKYKYKVHRISDAIIQKIRYIYYIMDHCMNLGTCDCRVWVTLSFRWIH